ncbi:MAG TPA: hypothetical protein VGM27_23590 [Acidobacteriaceae bacterium]
MNVKGQYSPNPAFLAFVTVSGSLIAQDQAADQSIAALAPPYKTVTFSYLRPKRATIPFFSHGYLIQVKHFTIAAGGSNLYLYNSDGGLEHELAIWPPTGRRSVFSPQ